MSKLIVLMSAVLVAGGAFAAEYAYVGGTGGGNWNNDWNASTDSDTGNAMWSSSVKPTSGNDYVIDNRNSWVWFKVQSGSDRFLGDSLTVTCPTVTFNADNHNSRLTVSNLVLGTGSRLDISTAVGYNGYGDSPYGLSLTGTPQINGTLRFYHKKLVDYYNRFGGYLSGNLTGQGVIQLCGDNSGSGKKLGPNWRIDGNNSGFSGKFVFQLLEAMNGGEAFATGVEITSANALGGARSSFTPDAVEIRSWNGLVTVGSDITLNADNCGILMQTNSFFEVPANRVLTVAEPIRLTGGFFKKGAGTLALTGGFSFGADGSAAADGSNSALTVKEGVLRVTQADDLEDIDVSMSGGAMLELAGTTTATFRSLRSAGVLTVLVDCTGLTPGSTQTITLNIPTSDAEALGGNVDVMAKGESGSSESELTVTQTGATITFTVPLVSVWHNYTGSSGYINYGTSWNAQMDGDDPSKYVWDSHLAAVATDGYIVNSTVFFVSGGSSFNGGALHVTKNTLEVSASDNRRLRVSNLTVDAGATFKPECSSHSGNNPTLLEGDLWRIDGTLQICALNSGGFWCPTVPLIGSGLVQYSGWGGNKALDQRLESDNSRFHGKFLVGLPNTANGVNYAAGLRIIDAKALGGALGVMTPDALTLRANNGLIVGESLTLATENRGILMQTNAYFEVESGKTLTLKEPIRVVNGVLKKGSGTLSLGGDVTIGANGTGSPDGTNNKLTVQAGTIKAAATNGIAKLAFDFASGTRLELDAFPADDGVKKAGFYFSGDTPFTAADAKIPMNIAFTDGYVVETNVNVVLCTVKSANVAAVTNRLSVTATGLTRRYARSFWTEDAGNGLARIGYNFKRGGFIISLK